MNTNFSIFNTVNTLELPEGSSNFMQTTYSLTDAKRQIPNEISGSSDQDSSVHSEGRAYIQQEEASDQDIRMED